MKLNTVIFDMDGLLIDSEPLWARAAAEWFATYGKTLSDEQYAKTTGLRTKEFLQYWFTHFNLHDANLPDAEAFIVNRVVELVKQLGKPMPGVAHIFDFFINRGFRTGLATSSGEALMETVIDLLNIRPHLNAVSSADKLAYGKPHPEVYLNCAKKLTSQPGQCVCFEDSLNGLMAAKAAGMKCVVIPANKGRLKTMWDVADLTLDSLACFDEQQLRRLNG